MCVCVCVYMQGNFYWNSLFQGWVSRLVSFQEVSPEIIYKNYPEFWYCRLFGKYLNIHKRCSKFPACFSQTLCETDRTKANKALGAGCQAKTGQEATQGRDHHQTNAETQLSITREEVAAWKKTGKGWKRAGKLVRWYPAEDGTMSDGLGQEFCYLPISKLDRVITF